MCDYCKKTKAETIEMNYISPNEDFCPSCKLKMLTRFVQGLDYDVKEVFQMYMKC